MNTTDQTHEASALSLELQRQVLDILNNGFSTLPHVAAHGLIEVVGHLLVFLVQQDAARLPWALAQLDALRGHVEQAAWVPATQGERTH